MARQRVQKARLTMSECIEHTYTGDEYGYLRKRFAGTRYRVHRLLCCISYNMRYHDKSWVARHTCDNPRCIRVEHLIVGSQHDNVLDAHKQGKYNSISEDVIDMIRTDTRSSRVLAQDIGVSASHIRNVRRGIHR